ncbi:hypothetical protein BpHYR1_027034 [Brachionus plicatilis]|uniref:Uncharacterized protein n=1 Tax=Brachionus plicatilis TaxID=10195 RepID=A0A3M7R8H2_BRAPC|nr:hypothetical protein BpHYR1_027034 [Brachionus plicatilis]
MKKFWTIKKEGYVLQWKLKKYFEEVNGVVSISSESGKRYKRRSLFQEIRKTRKTRKTRCQKIRNSGISIKSGFIYQLRKISTFQELDR